MYSPNDTVLAELAAIEGEIYALPATGPVAPASVPVRLLYWLRMLTGVATGLRDAIHGALRARTIDPAAPRFDPVRVGWLLGRARRWLRALHGRVMIEAVRNGLPPDVGDGERLMDLPDARRVAAARPANPAVDEDVFGGRSTAEIVAHICADLTEAARLLLQTETVAKIAAMAEAVRSLWAAAPAAAGAAPAAGATDDAMRPSAAIAAQAPDSG